VRPLRLTTAQLNQVMRTAQPIPLGLREEYLVLVARSLSGRDFGDGDVYRACAAACATAAKVAVRSHEVILITTHGTMS
jgi:hypothetical protein